MYSCIAKFYKAHPNFNTPIEDINKMIKDGQSGEAIIKKLRKQSDEAFSKHPAMNKKIKEIEDKFNNSDNSMFQTISYHLVPEAGKGNKFTNVESFTKDILDSILYKHHKTLNNLRNKLFGNGYKKNLLTKMVRHMFDGGGDAETTAAIKEFNIISEASHNLFTKSGGEGKPFKLQFQNNTDRILTKTIDEFVSDTLPLVKNSEDEVRTLYNKGLKGEDIEDLILDFNSADNYLKYSGMYGQDIWSSFMNKLQKQATDTAFNTVFGKQGNIDKLMKKYNLNAAEQDRIIALQDALTGNLNIPINKKLAKYTRGARSLASATMLGGATLSAVADLATGLVTSNFNGMPAIKTMLQGLHGLFKMEDNKQILAQLGFITDDLIDGLKKSSRFDPHAAGTDILSEGADKVLRASGLMYWTTAVKNAWKLSNLANLATLSQKSKTIPKKLKQQMDAYGITQKDWTEMGKQGGDFIDVTKLSDELNHKLRRFVKEEADYAVLEPGASNQAYMALGTRAGTATGEVVRMGTQFKSFLLAGVLTHLSRIMKLDTSLNKAEYFLKLTLAGVTVGMFVNALKDIKNGNDPLSRDYTDEKNYREAIMVSGAFGPLGDLVLKDSKFGQSPLDMFGAAGSPVFSTILKLASKTKGVMSADDTAKALGDLERTVAKLIPGRNLFYTQWATDVIGRQFLLLHNPDYQKVFDQIDRAKKARDSKSGLEEIDYFQ